MAEPEVEVFAVDTPECMICHRSGVVLLTPEEYDALGRGEFIQDALPTRDASFRELVKSGIHPACWDSMFTDEERE